MPGLKNLLPFIMNRSQIFTILIFFCSFVFYAQQDTILTKNDRRIVCHILHVGLASIEYQEQLNAVCYLDLYQVQWYFSNGKRNEGKSRSKEVLTLKKDTVNLTEELTYLRFCLTKFHTQYTTGQSITFIGTALAASSIFITKDQVFRQQMGIAGIVILLVGLGCSVDAHKWLGRAGWGVSGKGNSVEVHYRFR